IWQREADSQNGSLTRCAFDIKRSLEFFHSGSHVAYPHPHCLRHHVKSTTIVTNPKFEFAGGIVQTSIEFDFRRARVPADICDAFLSNSKQRRHRASAISF